MENFLPYLAVGSICMCVCVKLHRGTVRWWSSVPHLRGTVRWWSSVPYLRGTVRWWSSVPHLQGTVRWWSSVPHLRGIVRWWSSVPHLQGTVRYLVIWTTSKERKKITAKIQRRSCRQFVTLPTGRGTALNYCIDCTPEEADLLYYCAMWSGNCYPTVQRNVPPSSSQLWVHEFTQNLEDEDVT